MKRPTVDSALEPTLDDLVNEGHDARDAGDHAAALAKWREAWELLPEPKLKWDYYGQTITRDLAGLCIETGRLDEAVIWIDRLNEAHIPHSTESRALVDALVARLNERRAEEPTEHPGPGPGAGWDVHVPEPDVGEIEAELDEAVAAEVGRQSAEADAFMERDAPGAAAAAYAAAIALLPQPYTQWEESLDLYVGLCDACLESAHFLEAEQAARIATRAPGGTGNGYVWLRLGDALRCQGRHNEAREAYLSAYELAGRELFDGEEQAWAALEEAGIPSDGEPGSAAEHDLPAGDR